MPSPNIAFDNIPPSIRRPGVYSEFNLAASRMSLPGNGQKVLLLAQKLKTPSNWAQTTAKLVGDVVKPVTGNGHYYVCIVAGTTGSSEPTWPTTAAGTVTDGTVTWLEWANAPTVAELVATRSYSAAEAATAFGAGSLAHLAALAAFESNNNIQLTICAIDDAAGTKASGTIALSGTSTAAGELVCYIGNVRIPVAVSIGQAAATVAANLNAAIVAAKASLPATPSISSATITLTAKNAGTLGNQITVECPTVPAGLTATVTEPASGATDPDIHSVGGLLDKVFPGDYDIYISTFNDATSLGYLKNHLDDDAGGVSGPIEMRPAICVFGYTDEAGNIAAVKTLAATTMNHWRFVCGYLPSTRSHSWDIAAALGAALAAEEDPARILNGIVLDGIGVPDVTARLSNTTIEDLLVNGVTPLAVVSEQAVIVRCITTYVTNAQGVADPTRLDVTTPRSMDYVRKTIRQRITTKFPRAKRTIETKKNMRSECLAALKQLETVQIVEDVDEWKDYLIVEDDTADATRVNIRVPADIVQGLHVTGIRIDLVA